MRSAMLLLLLAAMAACTVCVHAFDDLPAFPAAPASLLEITESDSLSHSSLVEPAAASALVELDTESLPLSEVALAAAFPESTRNPLTAALAIEVPSPATFLKDDVFLQQLASERVATEARESAAHSVEAPDSDPFFDQLVSGQAPPPPPIRRRIRQPARSPPVYPQSSVRGVSELTDLYNNRDHRRDRSGKLNAREGRSFPSHQRGSHTTRFPIHEDAPHHEVVSRSYRSNQGAFERNLAWRDNHSARNEPFPHHGGHISMPHNKGRKNAKANLPPKPLSRHLKAAKKGSLTNKFPKPVSMRAVRKAARAAARTKAAKLRQGGKKGKKAAQKNRRSSKARKGGKKGRKGAKAGKNRRAAKKGGKRGKPGKHGKKPSPKHHQKPGKRGVKGPHKAPSKPKPHQKKKKGDKSILGGVGKLLHRGTKVLARKAEAKTHQVLNKAEAATHKGISRVADKLRSKVAGWGKAGQFLTKGINSLQAASHKGVDKARDHLQAGANGVIGDVKAGVHAKINTEIQSAKNALKARFGGFFSAMELKQEILAQRAKKKKAGGKKASRGVVAPPTAFKTGFEHVNEQRADMRAEVQKFKDEEFAATQARADIARLTAIHAARQAILNDHKDANFKAHSNLHTMFGASNGIFDRMPTHWSQGGRRGSPAQRAWTPARRIVPQRLARLEDERMLARRRTFSRGTMADRYHAQMHGENLGVLAGPGEYPEAGNSFIQQDEHGVVHDAAPQMRALPPM